MRIQSNKHLSVNGAKTEENEDMHMVYIYVLVWKDPHKQLIFTVYVVKRCAFHSLEVDVSHRLACDLSPS